MNIQDFDAFYQEKDTLYRHTVRHILQNPQDREEVLQEGYLKIWRGYQEGTIDSMGAEGYTVMVNTALDKYRHLHGASRRPEYRMRPYITFVPYDPEIYDHPDEIDGDPLERLVKQESDQERAALLDRVIEQLPYEYRLLLTVFRSDLHYKIRDRAGKPSQMIKARKYRAFKAARALIEQERKEAGA
jgi:DNA-directed RNA polymerase specialized sigma24 family protein